MSAALKISDCMKKNVVAIPATATIGGAASLLASRHIGSLPVVDRNGRLVGLLQLRDLLALVLPDFVHLVEDFDFVEDFGAIEERMPDLTTLRMPVEGVMQPAISVEETCGLLRAFSVLYHENIHDLPVVDAAGVLTGIASRVDIGAALLDTWKAVMEQKP